LCVLSGCPGCYLAPAALCSRSVPRRARAVCPHAQASARSPTLHRLQPGSRIHVTAICTNSFPAHGSAAPNLLASGPSQTQRSRPVGPWLSSESEPLRSGRTLLASLSVTLQQAGVLDLKEPSARPHGLIMPLAAQDPEGVSVLVTDDAEHERLIRRAAARHLGCRRLRSTTRAWINSWPAAAALCVPFWPRPAAMACPLPRLRDLCPDLLRQAGVASHLGAPTDYRVLLITTTALPGSPVGSLRAQVRETNPSRMACPYLA